MGRSTEQRRKLERHYLLYYLRVVDRKTGDVIGNLVDINEEGIMIMRDSPVKTNEKYSLRLRWRDSAEKLYVVDFEAEIKWCRPDVNPDFYGVGCAIKVGEIDHVESIRSLIRDLRMPG